MFLIIISILLIIGGVSGGFVDKLTGTSTGLIIFGVIGLLVGLVIAIRKGQGPRR